MTSSWDRARGHAGSRQRAIAMAAEAAARARYRHCGRRRRGYATEAVRAMVADILQLDSVEAITANVELDNPASIRVLEKSGMTLRSQGQQEATYHVRRLRPGR